MDAPYGRSARVYRNEALLLREELTHLASEVASRVRQEERNEGTG